jgi:glucose/arabinose dehydrogenase
MRLVAASLIPVILLPFALALALSACQQSEQNASAQTPAAPGSPVQQGAANKKDAVPAFPGQTRAPESRSNVTLKVQTIADGIDHPWGSALLPDGALLVTSRSGKLWLVVPGQNKVEITGVPAVDARGQGGLLDISLAPDFATSRRIYFSFSEPRGDGANGTSLASAVLSTDRKKLEGVKVIFQQQPAWKSTLHFGSNIEWDSAGNIFLTVGERSLPEPRQLAQDLTTDLGKVIHVKPDGSPAPGNPFIGSATARPEIWSYGHRNVQGAAVHPDTGKLWTIEHGPRGGDEINVPLPGKNYGWPIICYCIDYPGGPIGEGITAKAGLEQPVYYWDPVIAPGDMIFYRGNLFPWTGNILASALSGSMVRLELNGEKVTGEERLLKDQGRIRDILEAQDGSLYVLVDDAGKVLHVTPA